MNFTTFYFSVNNTFFFYKLNFLPAIQGSKSLTDQIYFIRPNYVFLHSEDLAITKGRKLTHEIQQQLK